MSVQPNQSMEAKLRAYARNRGVQPQLELGLDGATRGRLQDEVRRVYGNRTLSAGPVSSRWVWIRVALAGVATVLVLLSGLVFWPNEKSLVLSRKTHEPPVHPLANADRETGNLQSESLALARAKSATREKEAGRDSAETDGRATPQVMTEAPPTPVVLRRYGRAPSAVRTLSNSLSGTTQSPAAPEGTLAERTQTGGARREFAGRLFQVGSTSASLAPATNASQTFQQIQRYRLNPNSPPPPQVLQSFRWNQEGDAVQIVDADGSVYSGQMTPTPGMEQPSGKASEPLIEPGSTSTPSEVRAQLGSEEPLASMSGDRFAVTGTNRSLNVKVVFEGVLLHQMVPQQIPPSRLAGQTHTEGMEIQGQARVGNSTRLDIVALPSTTVKAE